MGERKRMDLPLHTSRLHYTYILIHSNLTDMTVMTVSDRCDGYDCWESAVIVQSASYAVFFEIIYMFMEMKIRKLY